MQLINRIFYSLLINSTECKVSIKNNDQINEKDYQYYVMKTVEKINSFEKYNINGYFLQQNGHNYSKTTIKYDKKLPKESDVHDIINLFFKYQAECKNKKNEQVTINLNLHNQLKLVSNSISIEANNDNDKIIVKAKVGFIPVTHKAAIEEYPVISRLISKDQFDLQHIEYQLYHPLKQNGYAALLFYHKHTNKQKINNFVIIILGDKDYKKYHIFNIVGVIFCIDHRTYMLDTRSIQSISHESKTTSK